MKTARFGDGENLVDPINAVRIFNKKRVDELVVRDIDMTNNASEPDYEMIRKLAAECRMPFRYGGSVVYVDRAKKIIGLGAEEVAPPSRLLMIRRQPRTSRRSWARNV